MEALASFAFTHWRAEMRHILSGIIITIIILIIAYINKATRVLLMYCFESVSTAHTSRVEATC
jgi:hypothetical protein